ncbi:MAG: bifunctional hydroxymethylpyrimidine kinase/phosphomethylpyrimidine kinase [Bacteroidales bacterium]|nr:bifunctional hydroxymethylpyrimidine kinase/phosphomethylpyrimidine kinase [Bacteroidales bacterium]
MTDFEKLTTEVSSQQVLIIGDVMIDSYLWGNVDRISPEAPVPIVAVNRRESRLGGAANVALNIQAMGAKPIMCTVLGNDEKSNEFVDLMKAANMNTAGVIKSDERVTTVKFRILGNNVQLLRVDEEITSPLSENDENALIAKVEELLNTTEINAIIFQDYDKGNITQRVIAEVTTMAKAKGIPTTVDPKKRNFGNFTNVTLFKPNLKELREGLNIDIKDVTIDELRKAADVLHKKQGIDIVFVTLSEKGAYICDYRTAEPRQVHVPAHLRSISDVSGAGDTVISVATLCLALGLDIENIIKYSNLAGGIVCESVGVVPIERNRFYSELEMYN